MTAPADPGEARRELDPGDVVADLPADLLEPLLRAVRRAADELSVTELPSMLRPFAHWKPDRLLGQVPRRALATALHVDPHLREVVAGHLQPAEVHQQAGAAEPSRLARTFGPATAVAALALHGRWAAIAAVGAEHSKQAAAKRRAAAEAPAPRPAPTRRQSRRPADDRAAAERRSAEAAAAEARRERSARQQLEAEITALRDQVARLEEVLAYERRRAQRREAALRRRLETEQRRTRAADDQVRLLRTEAVQPAAGRSQPPQTRSQPPQTRSQPPQTRAGTAQPAGTAGRAVPRDVPPAQPGRPCRLPAGVRADTAAAVRSLLQVRGLRVLVDGYNVTKHPSGRPASPLEEQRRWLLQLAGGLAGRYRRRLTIVFDGVDALPPSVTPRGVQVVFTERGETADDRIIHLAHADRDTPLLVVSGDAEVRAGVSAAGADVASAAAFLDAVRA